jgi:hypothetical protein
MGFANPIWLWGLTGLIVPAAIHLLSLKEGRIVYIGSLRHLRESNTAQFSSIRLNEIWLLVLRSLLITILVLFLGGFHLSVNESSFRKWLVVESELIKDEHAKILIDSLEHDGYEIHLLESGFPFVKDSSGISRNKNNWVLARELADQNLSNAIVISQNLAKDFRGERAPRPTKVNWISIAPAEKTFDVAEISISRDSVWNRVAQSTPDATQLNSQFAFASNNQSESKIRIHVRVDDEFTYDAKILLAALKAIDAIVPFKISIESKTDSSNLSTTDWIIWLSNDKLRTRHSNVISVVKCDDANAPVLQRGIETMFRCENVDADWWVITKKLNEDVALNENLTIRLANILLSEHEANTAGQRTLAEESIWSETNSSSHPAMKESTSLNSILMLFFGLTLLIERIVAQKRNQ